MADNNKKYTLLVRGKRITVTKEGYKAYYNCRDREKSGQAGGGKQPLA